ncbi:hypothetical protein, partial [Paenibacillus sp. KR2-11]|uniref:hypothetical protein n=1 Tax=Paenibacillus sp. KR2-11 TaxID=3385500 RepID=UPI0038FC993C
MNGAGEDTLPAVFDTGVWRRAERLASLRPDVRAYVQELGHMLGGTDSPWVLWSPAPAVWSQRAPAALASFLRTVSASAGWIAASGEPARPQGARGQQPPPGTQHPAAPLLWRRDLLRRLLQDG